MRGHHDRNHSRRPSAPGTSIRLASRRSAVTATLALLGVLAGCGTEADATPDTPPLTTGESLALESEARERAQSQPRDDLAADTAIFAGGCFWCMEPPFDRLDGVHSTTSGFIGGHVENPTYEEVTTMRTGHLEAVQVVFDPGIVDYGRLLEVYWVNVDPLDNQGQFCDRGPIYRPAIFFRHAEQEALALASRRELEESGRFDEAIVVEITEASQFWPAEEYHQGFYLKNPDHYQSYRISCGRDQRLEALWGDELR